LIDVALTSFYWGRDRFRSFPKADPAGDDRCAGRRLEWSFAGGPAL